MGLELRRQKTEDRRQKTEDGTQNTEFRTQNTEHGTRNCKQRILEKFGFFFALSLGLGARGSKPKALS